MAATDSYRLAVKETTVDAALPELRRSLPARALQEALTHRLGTADEIQLGMQENHVFVFGADVWAPDR